MAEQKESSVLFSLKELMNLEEDRIRQEESARKAKQEAELQARLDAERRQREEEEARLAIERRQEVEQWQREWEVNRLAEESEHARQRGDTGIEEAIAPVLANVAIPSGSRRW